MPVTWPAQIGTAAYLLIGAYAFFRSDEQVRWAALAILADEVLYLVAWRPLNLFSDRPVLAALDAGLLVALVAIAWSKPAPWLIAAGALQLICTLTHPISWLEIHVRERAVATLLLTTSYGVLACLLWGAVDADRRAAKQKAAEARLEADQAIWRAKGDAEQAYYEVVFNIPKLEHPARARAHRVAEELLTRFERQPSRGDTATRMLYRDANDR